MSVIYLIWESDTLRVILWVACTSLKAYQNWFHSLGTEQIQANDWGRFSPELIKQIAFGNWITE